MRYFLVNIRAGAFIEGFFYPEDTVAEVPEHLLVRKDKDGNEVPALPLWGIECDKDGNLLEDEDARVSAREQLGDRLGEKLAGREKPTGQTAHTANANAGNASVGNVDANEAEARAATIKTAVEMLDPANDDHWTQAGQPKVETVQAIASLENVTRKEIEDAAPGFARPKQAE